MRSLFHVIIYYLLIKQSEKLVKTKQGVDYCIAMGFMVFDTLSLFMKITILNKLIKFNRYSKKFK